MIKFRTIDRYIFRELIVPFFLGMATITLVLFIQRMYRLAELVISKGVTLVATIKLFFFIMPGFLVITIPMSTLLAALVAFTRLSSDSEITAMKASRISLYHMLRPVMFLAFLAFLATAVISMGVLPAANRALKEHMFTMVKSSAVVGIEPGAFTSKFDGMLIYVSRMQSADILEGIFISDERSAKDPYVITARRGKLIADPQSLDIVLFMEDGSIHTSPRDDRAYTITSFKAGRLYMDINEALLPRGQLSGGNKDTGSLRLIREIRRSRAEGKPALSMESELHTRLSIPVACLVFGLLGAPLGIRRARTGKSAGIAIALAVFLVYYIILGTGKNIAESGALPAAAAYWVPNALMAALAAAFVFKRGHEIDLGIHDFIARLYRRLVDTWNAQEKP